MHVVNAMFGRRKGGIEQSFLDYCNALLGEGNIVTALIHHDSEVKTQLYKIKSDKFSVKEIENFGQWDIFAVNKIRKLLKDTYPDVVISHGNRAISLLNKASKNICPIVGVAHNYSIKRLKNLDAAFTITKALYKLVNEMGQKNIFHIPNMIPEHTNIIHEEHSPIVIGSMGRFVTKKGFDTFIDAISILNLEGEDLKAVIGGNGEEDENLHNLAEKAGLSDIINFSGWIEDKRAFFESIDIFCLPSLHEPFGIVLLEALSYGVPVVTTDSEGPVEIVKNDYDALIVEKGNAKEMAVAIKELMDNPEKKERFRKNGFRTIKVNYEISVVGKKIQSALEKITNNQLATLP